MVIGTYGLRYGELTQFVSLLVTSLSGINNTFIHFITVQLYLRTGRPAEWRYKHWMKKYRPNKIEKPYFYSFDLALNLSSLCADESVRKLHNMLKRSRIYPRNICTILLGGRGQARPYNNLVPCSQCCGSDQFFYDPVFQIRGSGF